MKSGKSLIVILTLLVMVGTASAARNFVLNGSFEQYFSSTNALGVTNGVYNGDPGSFAYGAVDGVETSPSFVPFWNGEANMGYVWNPTGSGGTNHFGGPNAYVGLTNVSDGAAAYGAFGNGGDYFRTFQNTRMKAEVGDTIIFSWDIIFLSADYNGGWFNGTLQFAGMIPPNHEVNKLFAHNIHTEPTNVWMTHSITQIVTAAQAPFPIQVQLQGAGVWVDNVRVEIERAVGNDNLIYNGSFELPFVDGYGQPYDPTVNDSIGYGAVNGALTIPGYVPAWNGEANWGYVWNPTGSGGINHFGGTVGLTNASDGAGAYGAYGAVAHYFSTWQGTDTLVEEGDTVVMSWDMNFLSADYGSSAWQLGTLQFTGTNYTQVQVNLNHPGLPNPLPLPTQDVWLTHSITHVVTADQAGSTLQVHFEGAGTWIDNVSLKILDKNYDAWIAGYGLTGPDADPDYDFEPDGIINFDEYAYGGNPTNPDNPAEILPTQAFPDAVTWEYVYRRRIDADVRGLTYDLYLNTVGLVNGSWNSVSNAYETATGVIDADFESVTNEIPVGGSTEGFINLEVTEN